MQLVLCFQTANGSDSVFERRDSDLIKTVSGSKERYRLLKTATNSKPMFGRLKSNLIKTASGQNLCSKDEIVVGYWHVQSIACSSISCRVTIQPNINRDPAPTSTSLGWIVQACVYDKISQLSAGEVR